MKKRESLALPGIFFALVLAILGSKKMPKSSLDNDLFRFSTISSSTFLWRSGLPCTALGTRAVMKNTDAQARVLAPHKMCGSK